MKTEFKMIVQEMSDEHMREKERLEGIIDSLTAEVIKEKETLAVRDLQLKEVKE